MIRIIMQIVADASAMLWGQHASLDRRQLMGLPSRGEEAKQEEPAQFMSQCKQGPHPFSWQRLLFEFSK